MVEARVIDMPSRGPNGKGTALVSVPENNTNLPPLIFIHGMYHGAWCWGEHFFPYFEKLGYPLVAFDCRGSGETGDCTIIKEGATTTIEEHCDDLECLLNQLTDILGSAEMPPPVLVSHSFGGMIVMKYLEGATRKLSDEFSGLITMCSLPPSGHAQLAQRYSAEKWEGLTGFATLKFVTDQALCRILFFGEEMSNEDISQYQKYFARDSKVSNDTQNLQWPSTKADDKGQAPFVHDLPPCFVIGAKDDFIVDFKACAETANYFGLSHSGPLMVDGAHDVMLTPQWSLTATKIQSWLVENVAVAKQKAKLNR